MPQHRRSRRATRNGARFYIETDRDLARPYAVIDTRTGEQVGGRFASRSHAEELRDAENAAVSRPRSAPMHAYVPNGTRAQRVARIKRYLKGVARGRKSVRNCGCGGRSSVANDAMAALSERELVDRLIAAEERAWQEFVRRYDRAVIDAITKVINPFSRAVPSDLYADARSNFYAKLVANDMKVLRSFDHDRGVKFSSWLYNVAKTTAYDSLRATKASHRSLAGTSAIEAWESSAESEFVGPERQYLGREELRELAVQVGKLSERDQELFRLTWVEGLDPEEVAAAMNVSMSAVYTRRHRIKRELGLE